MFGAKLLDGRTFVIQLLFGCVSILNLKSNTN